jgi:hypothetical protein
MGFDTVLTQFVTKRSKTKVFARALVFRKFMEVV